MKTPYAILLAGLLIAAAVVYVGSRPAYTLTAEGLRLNTRTGEISFCRRYLDSATAGFAVRCTRTQ